MPRDYASKVLIWITKLSYVFTGLLVLLFSPGVLGQNIDCKVSESVGEILSTQNDVEVLRSGKTSKELYPGYQLCASDEISVGKQSRASIHPV